MFSVGCAQSQNEEEQIKSMLKEFYMQYNAVWKSSPDYTPDEFEEKVFSLQKLYCSKKLNNELAKLYETYKLEHDLLTNDFGGTDEETLKSTLSVVKDDSSANTYVVSYTVHIGYPSKPRDEKNVIHLKIIKEDGSYKIDEVLEE